MAPARNRVVFFHPDLGIGGAERLVIDAAVGLQQRGHQVTIFTSHCDPTHCFEEARDGTLDVRVRGSSLVPQTILGRFWILCATLRQLHLILQIAAWSSELEQLRPQAFFVDQLSAGIPLLRALQADVPILFYCHFPDKLLVRQRGGVRDAYRWVFDGLESWTTGCADRIVVNSKFTQGIFKAAFPQLGHITPGVVYPCVDTSTPRAEVSKTLWPGKRLLLSVNRFERKKDVALAIRAYAGLSLDKRRGCRLVVAGGYDPRNAENSSYHQELEGLAASFKLKHATARTAPTALAIPDDIEVLFMLSVPSSFKNTLIGEASLLLYTPRNEHFGIVPLEAMLAGTPVLAANEGGPVETVVEAETGWLRDASNVQDWTAVIEAVLTMPGDDLEQIGQAGRARVTKLFSKTTMAAVLHDEIDGMRISRKMLPSVFWAMLFAVAASAALFAVLFRILRP